MSEPACPICALAQRPTPDVVFVNDDVIVVVPEHGLALGHAQVFPRSHAAIFEHLPPEKIAPLFSAANLLSSVLFELLRAQGTNIIVQNGVAAGQSVAHMSVHVVPRSEKDGLEFQWKMEKASPAELKEAEGKLKEYLIPLKDPLSGGEKRPIDLDRKPTPMNRMTRTPTRVIDVQATDVPSEGASAGPPDAASSSVVAPPAARERKSVHAEKVNYLVKHLDRLP